MLSLTHNEEQFENNEKVSPCFTLDHSSSIPPVIHQVVDSQEEEENIGCLESNQDAVEVEKLWAGEKSIPLHSICFIRIGSFPLITPRRSQKALRNPHVRQGQLT